MKEFRRRQYEKEITFLKGAIEYAKEVKEQSFLQCTKDQQDKWIGNCERRLEHIYTKMRYLVTNE